MSTKTQKAKITKKEHIGKIRENRKESAFMQEYAVIFPHLQKQRRYSGDMPPRAFASITLRIYRTDSRAYACIWIHWPESAPHAGDSVYVSGGGYAGGYGYHRASAAAAAAIRDAGINLSQSISGVGDSAIESALCAIARALSKKAFILHYAHA